MDETNHSRTYGGMYGHPVPADGRRYACIHAGYSDCCTGGDFRKMRR